ncbi:hypothetical protein CFB3_13110 [Clostridium folliculivorans]|uniref:Uncharacterized protein n=1 Tax=Clostridium folliculivorans TaxID=2886038 RepID=A0A9W5Y5D2_9CLOT|nr:hypothetical protein CFOLD11_37800 [Clostridium folliculivorans]GKU29205.1 hypothetical protein CFB3_13110 [Clostridium folliculivorans]
MFEENQTSFLTYMKLHALLIVITSNINYLANFLSYRIKDIDIYFFYTFLRKGERTKNH